MQQSDIIIVNNLTSYYADRLVLSDITFSIPRNCVTVIMGRSGCGKTTLLRHLIGLKRTSPGRVIIDGEDIGKFNSQKMQLYRRRIGVLFQSGALFSSMSVKENIAAPLKVHTHLPEETIRIMSVIKLNMVGLTDFCDYMPSQLSGGMKKRAGLARALAMDPEILFVDEPSSGLDPITAAGLDKLIIELRETLGMTIIVVTHELESAFNIADQLVVLDEGRLVAVGPPEYIRNSKDPHVVQFLSRKSDERQSGIESYISCLMKGPK